MSLIGSGPRPLKELFHNFALGPARKFLTDSLLRGVCREIGFACRERLLTPAAVVLCCLFSHLQGGRSLRKVENWFFSFGPPAGKRHGRALSGARAKLPAQVFYQLIRELGAMASRTRGLRWRGLRVVLVDGTTQAVARSPDNSAFFGHSGNQYRKSCHPLARMLWMVCGGTGAALSTMVGAYRTSEMSMLLRLLPRLEAGGVLIGDCAFCSWRVLWELAAHGRQGIFPRHQSRKLRCDAWQRPADYIETWKRPRNVHMRTGALPAEAPGTMEVRVIKRKVGDRWLTLCTTLLDPKQWPADEVVAMYATRWSVETAIGRLKADHLQPLVKAKSRAAAINEILSGVLAHTLTRTVIAEASMAPWRASHTEARELIVQAGERMREAHVTKLPAIYEQLLRQISTTHTPRQIRAPCPRAVLPRRESFPIRAEFRNTLKAASP